MENLLQRVESNRTVLVGKPVVKGTRLSVQFIVGLLASGSTHQEILDEYTYLTEEDIRACLAFAAQTLESSTFVPLAA
ncbi:MAG: DUF433 domain-containing protein [Cytophagaceae bacterium]|nr:DUF433 domain-containing protein [Cytophagaceae bacterium]